MRGAPCDNGFWKTVTALAKQKGEWNERFAMWTTLVRRGTVCWNISIDASLNFRVEQEEENGSEQRDEKTNSEEDAECDRITG